jgi:hypothetical protein
LTPLGQSSRTVQLETGSAVEMAFLSQGVMEEAFGVEAQRRLLQHTAHRTCCSLHAVGFQRKPFFAVIEWQE